MDEKTFSNAISSRGGDLFYPDDPCSHQEWIRSLVVALLSCLGGTYAALVPICRLQSDMCEQILPFIIHELLVKGKDEVKRVLSEQVRNFFARVFGRWSSDKGGTGGSRTSLSQGQKTDVHVHILTIFQRRLSKLDRLASRLPGPFIFKPT